MIEKYLQFKNEAIGFYDVLMHADQEAMSAILNHFDQKDAIPDIMPGLISPDGIDYYLFTLNTVSKTISPVWNFNYAYGHVYNGESFVGDELPDFCWNMSEYHFEYFNDFDKDIVVKREDRDTWPDKRPVFREK